MTDPTGREPSRHGTADRACPGGAAISGAGRDGHARPSGWLAEVRAEGHAVDQAVFDAVADTPTASLDRFVVGVSRSADYSRLWLVTAAGLAAVGGPRGRRSAALGVLAIGLASSVTNLVLKPVTGRGRPRRSERHEVPESRRVRRPASASFPSGHAASAFAFATAVGEEAPSTWLPLHVGAALVGYARVHTGVHYPSDVAAGAVLGALCGWTVRRVTAHISGDRWGGRRDGRR